MYSNRNVPDTWKNKLGYQKDVMNIFSKDPEFLGYLGRGPTKQDKPTDKTRQMSQTAYSSFPKTSTHMSSTRSDFILEETEYPTVKSSSGRTKYFPQKSKGEITDKDILNILEDFRAAYPIKLASPQTPSSQEENKEVSDNQTGTNNFNKTYTGSFRPGQKKAGVGGIFTLRHMKLADKQEMFKTSIYTKLIPPKTRSMSSKEMTIREKKKQKKEEESKYGPFLNFDYESFNRKVEITNPLVKKYLESINYFGPYFSYCPPCRIRNMEFYKELEANQCIELIKYIKKAKGKHTILPQ